MLSKCAASKIKFHKKIMLATKICAKNFNYAKPLVQRSVFAQAVTKSWEY